MENRNVGIGSVRAEIVHYKDARHAYTISPITWLDQKADTADIKSGQIKELVIAAEVYRMLWKFVVSGRFSDYTELWSHAGTCQLEVRLIDDSSGQPLKPSYFFEWKWGGSDRPTIRLIEGITLQ